MKNEFNDVNNNSNKYSFVKPELSVEDLTKALYAANLKLSETNEKLKKSEQMRSELISNLSHDFRSPITTLRSYVEYLLSFDILDEQEVFTVLNQMNTKILTLDYMMNEFFLFTSLEYSEKAFHFETVIAKKYLEDFFITCKSDKKYIERKLLFVLPNDLLSDFPYQISIDVSMLSILLDNLYTNALKFSKANDTITLSAIYQDNNIIISVSDTGIGIEKNHLNKIFDRTYMVSDSRTPSKNVGCGLGLSISKKIAETHGGKIWCDSTIDVGSTFYISIPTFPNMY